MVVSLQVTCPFLLQEKKDYQIYTLNLYKRQYLQFSWSEKVQGYRCESRIAIMEGQIKYLLL